MGTHHLHLLGLTVWLVSACQGDQDVLKTGVSDVKLSPPAHNGESGPVKTTEFSGLPTTVVTNTAGVRNSGSQDKRATYNTLYPNHTKLINDEEKLEKILQNGPKAASSEKNYTLPFNSVVNLPRYEYATIIGRYRPKIVERRSISDEEITQPPATIFSPSMSEIERQYHKFHKENIQDKDTGKAETQMEEDNTNASYTFGFSADNQTRDEKSDSKGNVLGSYSYIGDDGILRKVEYEAGAKLGFRINKVTLQKVVNGSRPLEDKQSAISNKDATKEKDHKDKSQPRNYGFKTQREESAQKNEPLTEKGDLLYSLNYKIPHHHGFNAPDQQNIYQSGKAINENNNDKLSGSNPTPQFYNDPSGSFIEGSHSDKQTIINQIRKIKNNRYHGVPLFTPVKRLSSKAKEPQHTVEELRREKVKTDNAYETNNERPFTYFYPSSNLQDQFGEKGKIEESIEDESSKPINNYKIVIKKNIQNNPYGLINRNPSDMDYSDPIDAVTTYEPQDDVNSYELEDDEVDSVENYNTFKKADPSTDFSTSEAILEPACIRRLEATSNKGQKKVIKKRRRKNRKRVPIRNFTKINPDRSYSFAYNVKDHSRQESVDNKGNVHSSYQTQGSDGTKTVVVFNRRIRRIPSNTNDQTSKKYVPTTSFLYIQNPTDNKYLSYLNPTFPRNQAFNRRQIDPQPTSRVKEESTYNEEVGNESKGSLSYPLTEIPLKEDDSPDYDDLTYTNPSELKYEQQSSPESKSNTQNNGAKEVQFQQRTPFRGNVKFKMPARLDGEDYHY